MEMHCDSQGHLDYKSHVGMHRGVRTAGVIAVTGVQTCALPISGDDSPLSMAHFNAGTEVVDIEETRSVEYRSAHYSSCKPISIVQR